MIRVATAALILVGATCSVNAESLRGSLPSGASQWAGFQIGLGVSHNTFTERYTDLSSTSTGKDLNASLYGGWFNQMGQYVLGVEGEFVRFNKGFDNIAPGSVQKKISNMYSLKGRLGYAAGRIQPYLALGLALTQTATTDQDGTGWVAGVGVDYLVSQNIVVGAQYQRVQMNEFTRITDDLSFDMISVRVGAKF